MVHDCRYVMSDEKIEQNVERLHNFLSGSLGCSRQDVKEIFKIFSKKYELDKKGILKPIKNKTLIDHKRFDFNRLWVEYIKNTPESEWRPKFNEFIDAQYQDIKNFNEYCKSKKDKD